MNGQSKPRRTKLPKSSPVLAIARWVKEKREELGVTQTQLGQELGLSQGIISRIERGGTNVTLSTAVAVLEALGGQIDVVPLRFEVADDFTSAGRGSSS